MNTFNKIESHEKDNEADRLRDMLGGIKYDIKEAKKEMRLEMMKAKLDIAEIRKDVLKVKNSGK